MLTDIYLLSLIFLLYYVLLEYFYLWKIHKLIILFWFASLYIFELNRKLSLSLKLKLFTVYFWWFSIIELQNSYNNLNKKNAITIATHIQNKDLQSIEFSWTFQLHVDKTSSFSVQLGDTFAQPQILTGVLNRNLQNPIQTNSL